MVRAPIAEAVAYADVQRLPASAAKLFGEDVDAPNVIPLSAVHGVDREI